MGKKKKVYGGLGGKPERMRPFGTRGYRKDDNNKKRS